MTVAAHYALALAAVVLTAVSQILLKAGASRLDRGLLRSFLDARTLSAYAIFVGVTVLNLLAYRVVPLKSAAFLLPLTLVLVAALSAALLGERPTRAQWIGMACVILGIAVFHA